MAYNFLRGDRDQAFLLPSDLRGWLPADHLAWFVLDVVDQLDLASTRFLPPTAPTGTATPPTTPRPCSGCCCTRTRPGAVLPADPTELLRGPRLPGAGRQ